MKTTLIILAMLIATPAAAKVGREGDCPSTKTGYCETIRDWWDQQSNRN